MQTSRLASLFLIFSVCTLGCAARDGGEPDDGGGASGDASCAGLECKVASCPAGSDTTVSGIVTAPNGEDPIWQAIVYVPSGDPEELSPAVSCDVCDKPVGGRIVTQTLTNVDGTFELHGVPVTPLTPIVIQKGRWRRTVFLPVEACAHQELSRDQARLPRNRSEGDMPRVAVAVGDFDAIECVLRNIGIDQQEFQAPWVPGAVQLYDNEPSGGHGAPGAININQLVTNLDAMLQYHLIFLNCSSSLYSKTLLADPRVRQNLVEYVNRGGRLYITDWSYDWQEQLAPFAPFICFNDDKDCSVITPHGFQEATVPDRTEPNLELMAEVDQSTSAGRGLASWLGHLRDPVQNGQVLLKGVGESVMMRQTAMDMASYPSTTWVNSAGVDGKRPLTVSFDYPTPPQQSCGRVLYSSYHTRTHELRQPFPFYCPTDGMIIQEHILEYLIFEIGACVGPLG